MLWPTLEGALGEDFDRVLGRQRLAIGVRGVDSFRNDDCVLCGRCVRLCGELWQAKALGFVGRGRERRVSFPFGERPDYCKLCGACVDNCPMTIPPCPGPMKEGEEGLCGICEGQLSMNEDFEDTCVWCNLGKRVQCTLHQLSYPGRCTASVARRCGARRVGRAGL